MHDQTPRKSIFVTADGRNVGLTFALVSSLFLLWGFCNGMIDVMDKHFQETLHLSLSQSAWVQFAHYLGYFLMSMPAGMLASRLGYRRGILAGLGIVAVGGFWFVPATHIAEFWAFLLGVCVIASGLAFLETVANPYTTVLGDQQYAAARINLAQSYNSIGWFLGPIAGSIFFYGKDAQGNSTGSQTLYIPYAAVGVVVLILAVVFFFGPVPDIKTEDDYRMDTGKDEAVAERQLNRGLIYFLLLFNAAALIGVFAMIVSLVLLLFPGVDKARVISIGAAVALVGAGLFLIPVARRISHHSVWSHPHFSSATLAQFFYVAAQAGIFSFLVNYMTSQVPPMPVSWGAVMDGWASHTGLLRIVFTGWFEPGKAGGLAFSDKFGADLASLGFICFWIGRLTGAKLLQKSAAHGILGLYAVLNVAVCILIFLKLGWLSVICVFVSYFFMSIMFPTIFALGIHGLGVRAKKASAFIVMAIMGGAILPKLMGLVADKTDISRGFIVPMVCFGFVAVYAFAWPKLAGVEGLRGVEANRGH